MPKISNDLSEQLASQWFPYPDSYSTAEEDAQNKEQRKLLTKGINRLIRQAATDAMIEARERK